jgi:flavodoxin
MKAMIVYTSIAHGNTEKVAKAMAEALGGDLARTSATNADTLKNYDLVGFGSGIYNRQHHKEVFDLVARMPATQDKKVFVFSTSGYGRATSNDSLKKELRRKGFKVVGSFACKGFDTYGINKLYRGAAKGRPNADDLEEARAFARGLAL